MENPFGLTKVLGNSRISFADINGDGTIDAFVGDLGGYISFFKNTGTNSSPVFAAPVESPFGLTNVGVLFGYASPTFVDIDGNGTLDAFVGDYDGNTIFFKNIGTNTAPVFSTPAVGFFVPTGISNPFGLKNVGGHSSPTFVDIDGNGTLDALIGNDSGDTLLFKNTGTKTAPAFSSPAVINPFGLMKGIGFASPTFVDINGDGTLDAFVGNQNGDTLFFKNTSTPITTTANTRNDFNGDGKSDIFWRNDYGSVALWQMNGATVTSGSLTSVPNIDASWKAASTGDFNGDGKSDVLWRNTNGSVAIWTMMMDGSRCGR